MTICFLISLPIFLLAFRLIMPYYAQLMLNKYYFCKTIVHSFLGEIISWVSPTTSSMGPTNDNYPPHYFLIFKVKIHLEKKYDKEKLMKWVVIIGWSYGHVVGLTHDIIFPFLGISNKVSPYPHPHPDSKSGLGLVFTNENNNPNVVGSSTLPLFSNKPMSSVSFSPKKKDPCEMGGGVDGLMSCTERLGFESCNDDSYTEFCEDEIRDRWRNMKKRGKEKRSEDKRNNKFPPPLPSLNQNGQPCFYLRPVRENGRLELTEVWIHRPQLLRAVRENGRLRLQLVISDGCCNFNEDEEREHEEQEVHDLRVEEEEEGMKVEELWNYGVNGESSRKCHEMVNYHRHHHSNNGHHRLHAWRQPCVSIR